MTTRIIPSGATESYVDDAIGNLDPIPRIVTSPPSGESFNGDTRIVVGPDEVFLYVYNENNVSWYRVALTVI